MTTFQNFLMFSLLYALIYALTGFPTIQSVESYLKMDPVEKKKVTTEKCLEKVGLSSCIALFVHLAAFSISCLNAQWRFHCHMH